MADFNPAFDRMLQNEGGYKLTTIQGDKGGMTYAGISRKYHPYWAGWADIDAAKTPDPQLVKDFYRELFWAPIAGDVITEQRIAETIFDFGVNAGPKVAISLAQAVVGLAANGAMNQTTVAALNALELHEFQSAYALAKIARYRDIVTKDKTQIKFLIGWINRALREASIA